VKHALASSPNSQTIGRNGELPFLHFLQRYLPATPRATSGHFVTPSGSISPQIDVIVADAKKQRQVLVRLLPERLRSCRTRMVPGSSGYYATGRLAEVHGVATDDRSGDYAITAEGNVLLERILEVRRLPTNVLLLKL
jgi:uncharacterized protein DUF6602